MKLALRLAGTFMAQYLRLYGKIFVHAYLLTLLLVVAKIAPRGELGFFWSIFPLGFALGFTVLTYSRNMGWVTALPISRGALVLSSLLANLAMLAIAEAAALPSVIVLEGSEKFWARVVEIRQFFGELGRALGGPHASAFGSMGLLVGLLSALFLVLISFPTNHAQLQARRMGRRGQKVTWRTAAWSAAWIVGFLILIAEFGSPLLVLDLAIGGIAWMLFFLFDQTFGLPPRRRRRYRNAVLAGWAVLAVGSVAVVKTQAGSDDRVVAFAAQEMLPNGMAGISEERFLKFAIDAANSGESLEKSDKGLAKVLRAWQKEWYGGKRIPYAKAKALFAREESLPMLFRFVDGRDVPVDQFVKFANDRTATETPPDFSVLRQSWFARALSDEEIRQCLDSENRFLRRLAVEWLGFRVTRESADRIAARYRKPPAGLTGYALDLERMEALRILGEMAAREFSVAEMFGANPASNWKSAAIPPADVDCEKCLKMPRPGTSSEGESAVCSDLEQRHCRRMKASQEYASGIVRD